VNHELLGQTTRYWVGQDKQGRYMWKRAGKRFSLTRGRGHDGCIREVLQESSRSSMYNVYDSVIYAKREKKLRCCEFSALYLLMIDYVAHDYSLLHLRIFLY
jgi:hypothetical protein